MRIIAGSAKGRRLRSPRNDFIRPTADKVKASFYNMIGSVLLEGDFLDLFAGTGNMGIEALSRGAKRSVFVDKHRTSVKLIHENLYLCGFESRGNILECDSMRALEKLKNEEACFRTIYIDPPYNYNRIEEILAHIGLNNLLMTDGLIGLERDRRDPGPELTSIPLQIIQCKLYGNIRLILLGRQ